MNTTKLKNIILNNNFINFLSNLGNFPNMNKLVYLILRIKY